MNKSLLKLITSPAFLFLLFAFSLNGWGQSAVFYENSGILSTEPGFIEVTDKEFAVVSTNLNITDSLSAVNINIDKSALQSEKLRIYPNPSDGIFTIEINKTESNKISVEILDITGKLVYRNDYPVLGTMKETIDLQNLNKGMYFLRIMEGDKISTMKLMFR